MVSKSPVSARGLSLYNATAKSDLHELRSLLSKGGFDREEISSALHLAVNTGDIPVCAVFLDYIDKEWISDGVFLSSAAMVGNADVLRFFLNRGAPPDGGDSLALGWACASGSEECVQMLLPYSDPLGSRGAAFFYSFAYGRQEFLKRLLPLVSEADLLMLKEEWVSGFCCGWLPKTDLG